MSTYLCKHVFLDLFIFVGGGSWLMLLSLRFPSLLLFRLYSANNLLKCSLTLRRYHGMALKIYSLQTTSVSFFGQLYFPSFVTRLKSIAMLSSLLRAVMFPIKNPSWYTTATHLPTCNLSPLWPCNSPY